MKYWILFLIFTLGAYAKCLIQLPKNVVKFDKRLDTSVILNSTCNKSLKGRVTLALSAVEGTVQTSIFLAQLGLEQEVEIIPDSFNFVSISNLIKKRLNLDHHVIKEAYRIGGDSFAKVEPSSVQVKCQGCQKLGDRSVQVSYNNQTQWFNVRIAKRQWAYSPIETLGPFNKKLGALNFSKTQYLNEGKDQVFSDMRRIQFYKLNKIVSPGQIVKSTDLIPKVLIQPSDIVKVSAKGSKISVEMQALSKSSGRYGDVITLYNIKTNRPVQAVVTDHKKAEIKL